MTCDYNGHTYYAGDYFCDVNNTIRYCDGEVISYYAPHGQTVQCRTDQSCTLGVAAPVTFYCVDVNGAMAADFYLDGVLKASNQSQWSTCLYPGTRTFKWMKSGYGTYEDSMIIGKVDTFLPEILVSVILEPIGNPHCPSDPSDASKRFNITPLHTSIYINNTMLVSDVSASSIVLCFTAPNTHQLEFRKAGYVSQYRTIVATPYTQFPDDTVTLSQVQNVCGDPTKVGIKFVPFGGLTGVYVSVDDILMGSTTAAGIPVCMSIGAHTFKYSKLGYIDATIPYTTTAEQALLTDYIAIPVTLDPIGTPCAGLCEANLQKCNTTTDHCECASPCPSGYECKSGATTCTSFTNACGIPGLADVIFYCYPSGSGNLPNPTVTVTNDSTHASYSGVDYGDSYGFEQCLPVGTYTVVWKKTGYPDLTHSITVTAAMTNTTYVYKDYENINQPHCATTCTAPKTCQIVSGVWACASPATGCDPACTLPQVCNSTTHLCETPAVCDGFNKNGVFDINCILQNPLYLAAGAVLLVLLLRK
jgi:hypothetical protein